MRVGILAPMSLDVLRWPGDEAPHVATGFAAPLLACLVNELLARDYAVTVFTLSRGRRRPAVERRGDLTVCEAPARERHSARDFFTAERRALGELLRAHPCDVLHAHWTYEYALAALASGRPTLVTAHDHAPTVLRHSPDAFRLVRLAMSAAVLRRAEHLTVTSSYLLEHLAPRARRRATIVPDFIVRDVIDRVRATPESEPIGFARGAGLSTPSSIVVMVANAFDRRKNVSAALQAQALLRGLDGDARLRLVGVGMQVGGGAHAFARTHGLTDGVEFLGPLPYPDALRHIARADVLLHTAREEAFGMTVLEAMALGTPVVAGRHSGNVPQLLSDGRCGVLCDVADPSNVAAAVRGLLDEPASARALATAARRRALTEFSAEAAVPLYLEAYRQVLLDRPPNTS